MTSEFIFFLKYENYAALCSENGLFCHIIIKLLKLASSLSPDLFSKGIFCLSDFSHDLAYNQSTNY